MSSILLTGARAPVTLELCRAFAQHGHRVYLADMHLFPIARWSTFVAQYFQIPAPAQHFTAFAQSLKELVVRYEIEHLIPTCEETFYVSKIKDDLPCRVWTSAFELLVQLHHKQDFLDLARPFFHIPATLSCVDFEDWRNAETYVFKPVFSRFGNQVIIGAPEKMCQAPRKKPRDWIAQERLFGQEICVYSVWKKGQLGGFSAYRPMHRAGKGASVYFEGYFQQNIFEAVKKFGEHYQFEGQLSFDLMLCKDKIYVLECNPRATSGLHLLGKDVAACFFSDELVIQRSPKAKVLWLAWILSQPRHLFRKKQRGVDDVIFHPLDICPAFLQGLSVLELLYLAIRHRQSLLAVSTRDIEFNG